MTQPKNPILIPDPREAKLPMWARERLRALRETVSNLDAVVAASRGKFVDTNVTLQEKPGVKAVPLPKNSRVAFRSTWGQIQVYHDLDGWLRVQGDNRIRIRPEAGNAISVELED